jgi:magnesium chelatase family protein
VAGALPAALAAAEEDRTLVCPRASGAEAAWVGAAEVIAPATLAEAIRHFTGQGVLDPASPGEVTPDRSHLRDLADVRGQERAKRALEIAAAGRHHLLMVGTPGSGKSMLAARLPGILPPLTAAEALETSMIHSLSGSSTKAASPANAPSASRTTPPRWPRSSAAGKGRNRARSASPTTASSSSTNSPSFPAPCSKPSASRSRPATSWWPAPTPTSAIPCKFMLIAAANPCKCGYLSDPGRACARAPACGEDYMGRISGPLMDRFDLGSRCPPWPSPTSNSPNRANAPPPSPPASPPPAPQDSRHPGALNADLVGSALDEVASPDDEGRALLARVAERIGLSARGYHRILRVARTIADLAGEDDVRRPHVAEAVSYRLAGASV